MFRIVFTIILFSIAMKLNGQVPGSFKYVDSLTYSLYTEKRWDELILAGNSSVKEGHDYYYMRMRIGIAYYEKRNYAMSVIHFRKALEFNENDQIALEYMFYSYYLFSRTSQAYSLLSSFYPQNRERILEESKIRKNYLSLESFFSNAVTDNIISDPDEYFSDPEAGSQIATRYFINNALSASHILGNHVSYYHSYTNLVKDNYLHYFDGLNSADLLTQRVVQNQYYGSLNFLSLSGWIISPSFHILTAGYPLITFTTPGMNSSAVTYNVRSNGYFTGIAVSKSLAMFVIGCETGYSYLNYLRQLQGTASLMVYPLGNTDIYIGGKISTLKNLKNTSSDLRIIKGFTAGFSIVRKVWIEFSGLAGEMNNYADNNGLYVYNSADILKSKFSARIIIPLNKTGMTIYAGGGISSYTSEFFPVDGISSNSANKLKYNSNNFTGGLSWNF